MGQRNPDPSLASACAAIGAQRQRYARPLIILHWLTLLLLLAVYATMELRGIFPKGSPERDAIKSWHYVLGLTTLCLTGLRLLISRIYPMPPLAPAPPPWQAAAARLVKFALYAFLIGMPLLGWSILAAEGDPVRFLAWQLPLPPLPLPAQPGMAELIEEIHEAGASAGYFLIGLHAAAALYHHYVLRDDSLRRMLPSIRPGGR